MQNQMGTSVRPIGKHWEAKWETNRKQNGKHMGFP